jgi:nitrite reductase/ring-hydroxylating ferredoxin subunit
VTHELTLEKGSNAVRLCRLEELVVGAARGFDPEQIGEDTVFVLRRPDGARAYLNRCPHQSSRLEFRKDRFLSADGTRVICHGHGAHFDPDTGVCTHGACLGQSLEPVPCRIEHGCVWILLRGPLGER